MPLSDSELCALIDRESKHAIGADDLTESSRVAAMTFYMGEAEGELLPPETDGRSKVVSKDLMDTVEWAMPSLMDIFASADDIVRFEPDGPEDEKACNDATNYIGYLIHRRNEDGFVTLHDAIKASLLFRMGVGKCYVDKRHEYRQERYEGLSMPEVELLGQNPDIEIVSIEQGPDLPPEAMMPGMLPELAQTFIVTAKCAEEKTEFKNEGVPPEEIRIARDCRVISDCRFIEHRRPVTLSYLREQGYDADTIDGLSFDSDEYNDDEVARHENDGTWDHGDGDRDESQREVMLSEAYIRVDFDEDGKSEYRRIVKSGVRVFENEITDDHPFWLMSPILMPYKVIGLSFYDLIEDLQRIKTALTRQVLDNVYLSNNPRTEAVEGQVNLDDLLNPRPGGVVRVKSLNATREIATPFVATAGVQMLGMYDSIRDTRTGVTEMNSAMSAESLSKSNVGSEGVQAMMQAGVQRLRLIARVLAETGFKRMYYLMLKNVSQYQDRAQQVKINGSWLQIDPREWKDRYNMTVSVGIGTFGRQQQVANLTMIAQAQKEAMQIGLAGPQQIYQTLTRLTESMGYRDSDQFFVMPQQPPPQQEPQQSPEAQAIVAAEQIKAQASMAKATMDNETRKLIAQAEIESKERVAMFEAQEKIALARENAMLDRQMPQVGQVFP